MNRFDEFFMLEELIESNKAEIVRLRALAKTIPSVDPSREYISGGPVVQCKFAEIMNKVVDLEAEMYREIDEYLSREKEIRDAINKVEDPTEKLFLRLRYIEHLSYREIAERMGYSIRQIHNIRKKVCTKFHLLSQ